MFQELMKKLEADKQVKAKEKTKEKRTITIPDIDKWQALRDSGLTIPQVVEETGESYNTIKTNTTKPMKSFNAYQWQDLKDYGFTGREIAEMYGVSPSLVSNGTFSSRKRSRNNHQTRYEWARLRASGVSVEDIAKKYGVKPSYVYKLAPISSDTVPASRLNLADLTKPLAITTNGDLVGYFTPIERDSNAEEKEA